MTWYPDHELNILLVSNYRSIIQLIQKSFSWPIQEILCDMLLLHMWHVSYYEGMWHVTNDVQIERYAYNVLCIHTYIHSALYTLIIIYFLLCMCCIKFDVNFVNSFYHCILTSLCFRKPSYKCKICYMYILHVWEKLTEIPIIAYRKEMALILMHK